MSDALRTELERKVGEYNFALERKYAFPGAVQVLDDITRLLPDDTWLTQLELRSVRGKDGQRELTLRGESANAGRLVSLLEDSKLFTQAAPRSPTTKIQPGPGEIFDVGAQLKPLPAPSAAPLDVTAPPPPAVAPRRARARPRLRRQQPRGAAATSARGRGGAARRSAPRARRVHRRQPRRPPSSACEPAPRRPHRRRGARGARSPIPAGGSRRIRGAPPLRIAPPPAAAEPEPAEGDGTSQ